MFYNNNRADHGLPHDPFKALVTPRPIGWISSLSADGLANLAPYSFFNAISSKPDMVCFSSDGMKDSAANIRETGEFVCNLAAEFLTDAMNMSSAPAPHGISEFELAGLETEASHVVAPPRIRGVPAALECRLHSMHALTSMETGRGDYVLVIGEVVATHIDDAYLKDGLFDTAAARPIARLGYRDYSKLGDLFSLDRPSWKG